MEVCKGDFIEEAASDAEPSFGLGVFFSCWVDVNGNIQYVVELLSDAFFDLSADEMRVVDGHGSVDQDIKLNCHDRANSSHPCAMRLNKMLRYTSTLPGKS